MNSHRYSPFATLAGIVLLLAANVGMVHAATITLSIPKVEAKAGGEVEIPIVVKGAKGMSALQMVLKYDPAILEVVKDDDDSDKALVKGTILPVNAITKVFTNNPGRLPILFVGGGDPAKKTLFAIEEDGTMLSVRFRVIGKSGQTSPLTLEKAEAFQTNDIDMIVKVESGEVTVGSAIPWWWFAIAAGILFLVLIMAAMRRKTAANSGQGRRSEQLVALPADDVVKHTCAGCGRAITIPPSLIGKALKCPACGVTQIP